MRYYGTPKKAKAVWKTGNRRHEELEAPESYEDFVAKFFKKYKLEAMSFRKGEKCRICVNPRHVVIKTPREPIYFMAVANERQTLDWAKRFKNEYSEIVDKVLRIAGARRKVGIVYFIEAEGTGFIKIGRTSDLEKRLNGLQVGNPYKLNVVKCLSNACNESKIHKMFEEYRHRGEWFRYEGELKKYIEALDVDEGTMGYKVVYTVV